MRRLVILLLVLLLAQWPAHAHDNPANCYVPYFFATWITYVRPHGLLVCLEPPQRRPHAPDVDDSAPVVDDRGVVNNPTVNDRANTCYDPGQVCISEEQWTAGWYRIRQQYGMI